jgi:hypothetical protein
VNRGGRERSTTELGQRRQRVATDERTRASRLLDGTRLVLDHGPSWRSLRTRSRSVRDARVADVSSDIPRIIKTAAGQIGAQGARFSVTASDASTAIQVVRGSVAVTAANGQKDVVRAGEEGTIESGARGDRGAGPRARRRVVEPWPKKAMSRAPVSRAARVQARRVARSRLEPGAREHEVKVHIVGPMARTRITETFRNDSAQTLEGVYQFPLPPDARIDGLSLDSGGFVDGRSSTGRRRRSGAV